MKKHILKTAVLAAITSVILGMAGCDRAALEEGRGNIDTQQTGEGKEDAVNTLQVGSKYKIVTPMLELKEAVVDILDGNYWPDTLLTEEELAERTGISENMYERFMAEYQHAEAGTDMMIIIEAKEDFIPDIEKYLNDYRELLLKIYEKQPQNKAKVFASRIETIQNHVCYVQLGADIARLENQGEEKMVEYCQQENERALDIIEKTLAEREE